MLLQTASRTVCEVSESITKPPHFRVPRTSFAHLKASYQIKAHNSTWSEAKPLGTELQLVARAIRELNPQINTHESKPKWFFKDRDWFLIPRIHKWQHGHASHNMGAIGISCWGGWAGWAASTNVVGASCSIGRSLPQGMAPKGWPAPPVHWCHTQRCASHCGAEEEELCFILPTHFSLCHYRFYCTRRWNWLGRDDQFLVGFFAIFFYSFRILHL